MLDSEVKRQRQPFADLPEAASSGGVQWTLKNVDREAIELSRQAARKRGMKFGAWVTQALRAAANSEMGDEQQADDNQSLFAKISDFEMKIDERIEQIQKQGSEIQHDLRVLQLLVPRVASK